MIQYTPLILFQDLSFFLLFSDFFELKLSNKVMNNHV